MAVTIKVKYPDETTGTNVMATFTYPNREPTENPPEVTVRVWQELIDEGVFDRLDDADINQLFGVRIMEIEEQEEHA
jgi:hypothetical protein